jgi:hypothetical protein
MKIIKSKVHSYSKYLFISDAIQLITKIKKPRTTPWLKPKKIEEKVEKEDVNEEVKEDVKEDVKKEEMEGDNRNGKPFEII